MFGKIGLYMDIGWAPGGGVNGFLHISCFIFMKTEKSQEHDLLFITKFYIIFI